MISLKLLVIVFAIAIVYAIVRSIELERRIDRLERAIGLRKGG